jgi:hypothetical protein
VSNGWLDRWAERDQRGVEEAARRARPRTQDVWWGRTLIGLMSVVSLAVRALFFVAAVVWIVSLVGHPSVRSFLLAAVMAMFVCFSAFTTLAVADARRAHGRSLLTGLPRRANRAR